MPKTKAKPKRVNIRLPRPLLDEVDRLLEEYPIYGNRQQFVESAIREKRKRVIKFEVLLQQKEKPLKES